MPPGPDRAGGAAGAILIRLVLAGATGLVGGHLARLLLDSGDEVHALTRRAEGLPTDLDLHLAPPDRWADIVRSLAPDVAISALGTTLRAAGSKAAFRAVDHDLVTEFARAAQGAGARRFILVSSVGADPEARNFYLRVKGETEQAVKAQAFERVDLVRPGLLIGARTGPVRRGERIGAALAPLIDPLLRGSLDRFSSIPAQQVAAAIAALSRHDAPGRFVHQGRALRRLADEWRLQIGAGLR